MGYDLEVKRTANTSPRSKYGHGSKPSGACIHHWGSDGQNHDSVVRWLRGSAGGVNNTNSSAHYVVSAGRVTRLADHSRATWHAGSTLGNGRDIGIECRPEMTDGDWQTLVELCADIEEEEGSLNYRRHNQYKNTACPGRYASRLDELVDAVNAEHKRRKDGRSRPEPKEPTKPKGSKPEPFPLPAGEWFGVESKNPKNHSGYWSEDRPHIRTWQQQMKDRGWNAISVNGRFRDTDRNVLRRFQKEKGIRVDGGLGPESWRAAWTEPVT